ncbi:MAG: hypothetical protein OXH28_02830 [bacterium]|nr:hypothetical protein [bacterium]MXV91026.1 hypothetical protein [Acidimicrobiia bacterium]MYC44601.1 hypothetical protein [Acidimicrobiia bacterium]MYI19869.1 hypothetical protein [Acidimicrobiia bacterium]
MIANSILAHQGGWDEILIIIGPIAAIVGIVALVRRRLHREAEETEADVASPTGGGALPS